MQTHREFIENGDRYIFDVKCSPSRGWAQLDTEQDAWYFGNWVNPITLEFLSYAEGDVTHHKAESPDEFTAELIRTLQFYERAHVDDMMKAEIEAALALVPGIEKSNHAWRVKAAMPA